VRESGVKAHRPPLARRTPSPLVGEGWGRGSGGGTQPSTHAHFLPTPTPIPSPQGGGEQRAASSEISVAGASLVADCAGALFWPEEQLLVVADLHLEKGSAFAARGVLLPPYDTAATLALGPLTFRHEPSPHPCGGEVAGHLHPQARIARRGRAGSRVRRDADGRRSRRPQVLPSARGGM